MTARKKEFVELMQMSDVQLTELVVSLKKEQLNQRIKASMNIETNTHVFKASKRKLARVNTLLRQRALQAQEINT